MLIRIKLDYPGQVVEGAEIVIRTDFAVYVWIP